MKKLIHISVLCSLLIITSPCIYAQNNITNDSIPNLVFPNKTNINALTKDTTRTKEVTEKHSPHKATVYSAIFPGLGQIYNKKWWKVPILYGGFITLGYYIDFNNDYYQKYKVAYIDITDNNPLTNSHINLGLEGKWDWNNSGQMSQLANRLKKAKEYARRNRDLLVICTVGLYAIQIIDASVDAHFFDFDISDDISLNWAPIPAQYAGQMYPAIAIQINF